MKHIIEQVQNLNHDIHAASIQSLEAVESPFVLFTYTDLLGAVPQIVTDFMVKHGHHCVAVIASGNTNFGHANFCASADKIASQYHIPIWAKIDLRGGQSDYQKIIKQYKERFLNE